MDKLPIARTPTLTGLDSPAAPKSHRSGMIGDTGLGQSEEWGKSRTVTADVKMGEIAEVELTHHRMVASSADTVRRCFRRIAEGGRSERDLRDERSGSLHLGIAGELGIARITMPIIQSTPKAAAFVGSGIVSVVDYRGPKRRRRVVRLGRQHHR